MPDRMNTVKNNKKRNPAPANYNKKFANFMRMLSEVSETEADVVVIHHPQVIGDTYGEIIESLNRISDANISLRIVPRSQRAPAK